VICICQAISDETRRNGTPLDHKYVVTTLNQMMNGWVNYFSRGSARKAYRSVEEHACKRLRQWLRAKNKVSWPAFRRFPPESLHNTFNLVRLTQRQRIFS
jgi:hypothetical protein